MPKIKWTPIATDLGHALWSALQVRLGIDVSVYESCTDPSGSLTGSPYILTVVGTSEGTTPLLRAERRREEHRFYVPLVQGPEE